MAAPAPSANHTEAARGRLVEGLRVVAAVLGVLAALVGALVLAGWLTGVLVLERLGPGTAAMKADTAIGFVLVGLGVALRAGSPRAARTGAGLGASVALLGVAGLVENVFDVALGIDQVLARDGTATLAPGRMSSIASVVLLLLGASVVLVGRRERGRAAWAQSLAAVAGSLGLLAIIGYAYGVRILPGITRPTAMSLSAAVATFLAASGLLLVHSDTGFVRPFSSPGAGGILARRLLPFAIVAPLVIDVLVHAGKSAGWYGQAMGDAIDAVASLAAFLVVVLATALSLDRVDAERRRSLAAVAASEARYRRLSADLEARTVELTAANKELEAFSYSVSHDLRAPLRTIDGFSQAVLEEYGDALDAHARDWLTRVRAGSQRMARLIDDLLDLSRLTRAELHREPLDLGALAREIADRLAAENPERRIVFEIAPGLEASGDPHLVQVVLENLLGNAVKFTSGRPEARVRFGREGGAFVVSDNGAGFDMAYADKLFGAFQRLHRIDEFPGTGIGLATVQRIVRRHGGWIRAQGEVDRGATFTFTLSSERGPT